MLTIYFSFGVPTFLFLLYFVSWVLHASKKLAYSAFLLVIISGFSVVFTLQIIDHLKDFLSLHSLEEFSIRFGYSPFLLYFTLSLSLVFLLFSMIQVYKEWHSK